MISLVLTLALAAQAAMGWTWTLYDGEGPLVLAHEIPDTPQLRATLECERGAGAARISVYGTGPGAAFATLASGQATASTEVQPSRGSAQRVAVMLPTDHPVFAAFAETGLVTLRTGDRTQAVSVPAAHLAKLRRFAELCGG